MKKLIAIALAVVLCMSLAPMAFAASSYTNEIHIEDTPYTYKGGEMTYADKFEPGKTYYFPIINDDFDYSDGDSNIKSTAALKNYSIKNYLYEGKSAFKSASFVMKTLDYDMDNTITEGKAVFLAVTLASSRYSTDVDFTFRIVPKTNSAEIGNDEVTLVGIVEDEDSYDRNDSDTQEIDVSLGSELNGLEGRYIINFDNSVRFHVNMEDENEFDFEYSDSTVGTSYWDLVDKYSSANLDFHIFLGRGSERTFKHIGKLYIPAEKGDYIYELVNGAPRQLAATYSRNEESFIINTKKLGHYVVSDRKLGNINTSTTSGSISDSTSSTSDKTESSSQSSSQTVTTNTPTTNPDTGANDILDVAVALSVVSLAAIGAICFKKQVK